MAYLIESSPLGQKTAYVSAYDPGLLFPIPRAESRKQIGIEGDLPFYGYDVWTGYELSWLNAKGKPQVAVAEFLIPCDSPFIIESKSFKLYLNSLNQTRFADIDDVKRVLEQDLSAAAGKALEINLNYLHSSHLLIDDKNTAMVLDNLDIEVTAYHPDPGLLNVDTAYILDENLCSHLLKSNCPVTGQPDWASLFIEYRGSKIDHEGLLRYIVSFREHQDFHEHCVERIFTDIVRVCKPEYLSVYARYTRRGGLDINPFRSTDRNAKPCLGRLIRQ